MEKHYDFSTNVEWHKDFMYVYSPIVKTYPIFEKQENCLANRFDEDIKDYEYISILSADSYKNAKLNVQCDFHKYGAPIIVFGNDISESVGKDGKSHKFYGVHFEVVAWERGCNIWYIVPCPESTEHPVKPTKILAESFKIEDGSLIDMTVEVKDGTVFAEINGRCFSVSHPEIPEEYHIGYTACEGINKLYKMELYADVEK